MAEAGSGHTDPVASPGPGEAAATGTFVTRKAEGYADDMHSRTSAPSRHTRSLLVAILVGLSAQAATLYRWVDTDGVVHWSDRPIPGSTPVEMPVAQGYHSATRPVVVVPPNNAQSVATYTTLEITAPNADAVLFETGGIVQCSVQLTPALGIGHTLWFELDGQRYDSHGSLSLDLPAPRGEHVLRAWVTDASNHTLIASAPLTFHVRQASIASPPVGSTVKRPR